MDGCPCWCLSDCVRCFARYLVSFLLDSSVGLLVIYAGIRLTTRLADKYHWKYLYFGVYGSPPSARAWAAQSGVYMGIMVIEKILITILIQLQFWDQVRDLILSPIRDPKVATIIVLLVIPFFVNVLMFWVTDNFLMKKPNRRILLASAKKPQHSVRYQRVAGTSRSSEDVLLSGDDEDLLEDEEASTPLPFKSSTEELVNVNRRNNSVV